MQKSLAAKNKKVVCWVIQEEDEGGCEIVFHHHGLAARRIGINAHGGCDSDTYGYTIRRAPEFDCFVEKGFVPIKARLEAGWWVHTSGEGTRICHDDVDDDENELIVDALVFTQDEKGVYLNIDECHQHALDINARDDKYRAFKKQITEAWPELEFIKWQGGYPWITFSVSFMFPGAQYGGSIHWDSDKPEEPTNMFMSNGDKDAWATFYKQIRPEAAA
ncbi:hypothetical protein HZI30_05525 [Serratia fonticola]|uniref:hypothetical protein n=1 Tax=Serratia fonticola TaxID=47917 RepID=UPI0015C60227|nr:hypothetical protein [Serratia fonticola]NXZ86396.1 hypothetical protein [Serratia fonticola]